MNSSCRTARVVARDSGIVGVGVGLGEHGVDDAAAAPAVLQDEAAGDAVRERQVLAGFRPERGKHSVGAVHDGAFAVPARGGDGDISRCEAAGRGPEDERPGVVPEGRASDEPTGR